MIGVDSVQNEGQAQRSQRLFDLSRCQRALRLVPSAFWPFITSGAARHDRDRLVWFFCRSAGRRELYAEIDRGERMLLFLSPKCES